MMDHTLVVKKAGKGPKHEDRDGQNGTRGNKSEHGEKERSLLIHEKLS